MLHTCLLEKLQGVMLDIFNKHLSGLSEILTLKHLKQRSKVWCDKEDI